MGKPRCRLTIGTYVKVKDDIPAWKGYKKIKDCYGIIEKEVKISQSTKL